MATKAILPMASRMSINNEITNLLGDICFKLGRLEKTKQGNLDLEIITSNVIDALFLEKIEVSKSIERAMKKDENISSSPFISNYFELNKKLNRINPYEVDFFNTFKELMGEEVLIRTEKTIEGISYPIPTPGKINSVMKSIFSYLKKTKNKVHPIIASATVYFSILTVLPLQKYNHLLAISYAKAILIAYNKTFCSIKFEKVLITNKITFAESISNSISELDQKYFAEEYLNLINLSLLNLMKGKIKSNKHYSNFIDKLLVVMEDEIYYSTNELTSRLGLKSRLAVIQNYIKPGIEAGKIIPLNPLSPRDRNQKYKKGN